MGVDADKLRSVKTPAGLPFKIGKLGHVVVRVSDLPRSVEFYTQVLGFQVSDAYPDDMMPGGMVFLRCNADHHCLALVGGGGPKDKDLHHIAFEVPTLDDVFRARDHLRKHKAQIDFEGRRRAGCQVAVEFRDPDGHRLEIFWGVDQVGSEGKSRPSSDWRQKFSLEEAVDEAPPGQDTTLHDPTLKG